MDIAIFKMRIFRLFADWVYRCRGLSGRRQQSRVSQSVPHHNRCPLIRWDIRFHIPALISLSWSCEKNNLTGVFWNFILLDDRDSKNNCFKISSPTRIAAPSAGTFVYQVRVFCQKTLFLNWICTFAKEVYIENVKRVACMWRTSHLAHVSKQ